MLFSKTLAALALATVALSSPVEKASEAEPTVTCDFIMTPTPELSLAVLQTSINYAVGRTIAIEFSPKVWQGKVDPLVRHQDGTYDVRSHLAVDDVSSSDLAKYVKTWDQTTLTGFGNNWFVNAVHCV